LSLGEGIEHRLRRPAARPETGFKEPPTPLVLMDRAVQADKDGDEVSVDQNQPTLPVI
jgi:hypothetical protein